MTTIEPDRFKNSAIAADSSAVLAHLGILQDIVTRMANNSASCKTWCITLVSAILVLIADKGEAKFVGLALLPVILFGLLDAYYLCQERAFRAGYNAFVTKLHNGQATTADLFRLAPPAGTSVVQGLLKALTSFAVYPFYLTLLAMIVVARFAIL
ncbi:hypothetical protein IQ254_25150 [Nodosilinea sp. LEGE 07088]|uniref:hypothetical protein n=1 Tax=Nodosilinea sp. LEGE 07088 TaxID=2777968 RepID=UPI001880AA70|nr:hypothetical protein [Nodosilinea sp. LEGE 07088]MBE9140448.1 hypothetical protein [Nodosilinea sp. LEGE 07088]